MVSATLTGTAAAGNRSVPVSRRFLRLVVCVLAALAMTAVASSTAHAAAITNAGTDFWVGFPSNYGGGGNDTIFLTGPTATSGTVSIPGMGFTQAFTVTPGTVTRVDLPAGTDVSSSTNDATEPKGVNITAAAPVVVYGLDYYPQSSDAFLGLPDSVLGTSYTVLAYGAGLGGNSELGIVGTQDGTKVTITPSVPAGGHAAGTPYTVTINQGDVYQLMADNNPDDLTGTKITSSAPINVFGGQECANVPNNSYVACDHLVQDLPPESAWGNSFLTVPLATRTGGDTLQLVADTNNTVVSINGSVVATLNAGQLYNQIITGQSTITSTKPILVGQYSNSSSYDNTTGDPFFMLIPPTDQFLTNYTITTPANGVFTSYVNLVVPNSGTGEVLMDGTPVPSTDFTPIGSSGYSGAQVPISDTSHTFSDGGNPFGVYTYGFASYDGYGYPGGFSLAAAATATHLTVTPGTETDTVGTSACVTATVTDQNNNPTPGVRVDFTVTGANTASGSVFADNNGQAKFCYTGTHASPPNDTITAKVGSLSGTATKTWTTSKQSGCTMKSGGNSMFNSGGQSIHVENTLSSDTTSTEHLVIRSTSGTARYFTLTGVTTVACHNNPQHGLATGSSYNTLSGAGTGKFGTSVASNSPGYSISFEIGDWGDSGATDNPLADSVNFTIKSGSTVIWTGKGTLTAGSEEETG